MQITTIFKALGEPVRLRLFALLAQGGEQCVCHLTIALDLPQSTVSRHLSVLRNAGLVSTRRTGKWMYYRLADDVPEELIDLLARLRETSLQLEQDMERLKVSPDC